MGKQEDTKGPISNLKMFQRMVFWRISFGIS